jgi:hypothetical protein
VCRSVRDTINNLVIKSPQSWQTSAGLPFFQITGTVIEWDECAAGVALAALAALAARRCSPPTPGCAPAGSASTSA